MEIEALMAEGLFMARGEKGDRGPQGTPADIQSTLPGTVYRGQFAVSMSNSPIGFNGSGGTHFSIKPSNYTMTANKGAIAKCVNVWIKVTPDAASVSSGRRFPSYLAVYGGYAYIGSNRYQYGVLIDQLGAVGQSPSITINGTSTHLSILPPELTLCCGEVSSGGDGKVNASGYVQIWEI